MKRDSCDLERADFDTYKLPTLVPPALSIEHHAADIRRFRTFLEQLEISTANTRIERYERYLQTCVEEQSIGFEQGQIFKNIHSDIFRHPIDWNLYVLREVHELMWILKGLEKSIPTGAIDKLRKIVSGSDFAALDKNSLSRDTQFELRVASYFLQSGCEVDLSTETDIIANYKKETYLVECKRVASATSLKKRLTEAREQIHNRFPKKPKRKTHGLIFTDVTKVAFSHNGLTYGLTNEHSRDVIQRKLVEIRSEVQNLNLFKGSKHILLCWLQIHIASLVSIPAMPMTRFSSADLINPNLTRGKKSTVFRLYKVMSIAESEDKRASAARTLNRREQVTIPEGTLFDADVEFFEKLFSDSDISDYVDDHTIGSMMIHDQEEHFSLAELKAITGNNTLMDKIMEGDDFPQKCITAIVYLYGLRYPFEGSHLPFTPSKTDT